ncbi:MAG: hypothetical protein R6V55_14040 [Desulfovermiculus sp.]
MADEKDISSTEKLLNVIRNKPGKRHFAQSRSQSIREDQKSTLASSKKHLRPFKSKDIVGVEIQATHVNVVRMSHSGQGWKANQAFSVPMQQEMALDSPKFRDFLQTQLRDIEGIKKAQVWAMLSAPRGEIWHTKVPLVKKGLADAVYWSAKRENNFEEDKVIFDYRLQGQIVDKGVKKYWFMVYTLPKDTVNNLEDAFSRAGIALEGITLPSFSLQNLFVYNWADSDGQPFAVLNIYQHNSSINIYDKDNNLLLSRTTKTGLESMIESMVQEQDMQASEIHVLGESDEQYPQQGSPMDRDQALKLITWLETGGQSYQKEFQDSHYSQEDVLNMIAPAMDRLARQVERTIDHSINVLGNPAPGRIYLGSRLVPAEPVAAFFQDQLGLDVQILEPLNTAVHNVSPLISSLCRTERILLTTATGLAMSSTAHTPNFLYTAKDREKQRIVQRNATLVATAVIAIYLLTGGYWFQLNSELDQVRQEVSSLNQQLDDYSPLVSQEMINDLVAQVQKEKSSLQDYSQELLPVAAMRDIISATPEGIRLFNVRMAAGKPGSEQEATLVLNGYVTGEEGRLQTYLTSYLYRLRQSPLFKQTEIQQSSTQDLDALGRVLSFVINVNLEQV